MDKKSLNMKDFMNIGIFAALNMILMLLVAFTIGYIPITYMMISSVSAFVCGIPMMIFYTKIKKFGVLLVYSVIVGLLSLLLGRGYYAILLNVVLALLAEIILRSGKYKSGFKVILSYAVYSISGIASYLPMYFASKSYLQTLKEGYGQEYVSQLEVYFQWWVLVVLVSSTFICGVLGGILGIKIFKKHFQKSGII